MASDYIIDKVRVIKPVFNGGSPSKRANCNPSSWTVLCISNFPLDIPQWTSKRSSLTHPQLSTEFKLLLLVSALKVALVST